jgi:mono/diheme cytochrome c family protein
MKNLVSIASSLLVGTALLGCASTPQQKTIEPGSGKANAIEPGGDSAFVLSRTPVKKVSEEELPPIHTSEGWWPFRAQFLGMNEKAAKERDALISEKQAPERFWDEQTALESINLWTALCNECHGGRRRPEDALHMPLPPRTWGRGEGLFFGKRRPYGDIFAVINKGGPEKNGKPSEMPPWQGKIAREQIWAIIYFLEYQSGGIEGPLAPSLQPRRQGEVRRVFE